MRALIAFVVCVIFEICVLTLVTGIFSLAKSTVREGTVASTALSVFDKEFINTLGACGVGCTLIAISNEGRTILTLLLGSVQIVISLTITFLIHWILIEVTIHITYCASLSNCSCTGSTSNCSTAISLLLSHAEKTEK